MNSIVRNSSFEIFLNSVAAFVVAVGILSLVPGAANAQYSGEGGCCDTYSEYFTPSYDTYTEYFTPTGQDTYSEYFTPTGQDTYSEYFTPTAQDTYSEYFTPTAKDTYTEYFTPDAPKAVTGIYEPFGGSYEAFGGTYETFAETYTLGDAYTTYFEQPYYASSYANPFYTSSAPFYNSPSYPYFSQQSFPFHQQPIVTAPGNTTISERTDIFAPTNTCTSPNSCNDNSIFNAPTTISAPTTVTVTNPAPTQTAIVNPIVVPQYNVQAYVPPVTYPTYPTYPSYQPYVQPYVAPVNPIVNPAPYVALTQIPYTGLDLGLFGSAAYWVALLAFALAAGYLFVYYVPAMRLRRNEVVSFTEGQDDGAKAEVEEEELPVLSPIAIARKQIPAFASYGGFGKLTVNGTKDSMTVVPSMNGKAPRIVISRS
ncbi:MAG: hypothetical protein UY63_C0015G0007 [Parcubacteria group bacterium GW2011_GWA2_51_10]|nr:MAG: hypothetical protein UY63_C0015G0007 [Parcubacteria group bacterium GW2011_GWA2_51_10]